MIMGRMACLTLVCLALGVSGEATKSPWESLTPTPQPGTPTPQPVTSTKQPAKHVFDQGQAIAQLAMTLEEEILVEMLPFKAPFKMDNKQMAGVIRLLKKAVKPVLKSERLRTMVSIADDYIQELENDKENKNYYIGLLNIAQDVYGELKRMYNSEEAQGRTFETVTSIYRQSVLSNYIVEPFTNWIISPITSRITYAAERVYDMLPSNTWVVDTEYINPFTSWGETFDYYVNQIAGWSARSRNALEATARLLEHQDEGRACPGCGNSVAWGSAGGSPGTDLVEVTELTWVLPTIIAIASAAALVAAVGGVGAAISIPLGIIGGLGGFTGPTLTVPVFTGTGVAITGTATNFAQGTANFGPGTANFGPGTANFGPGTANFAQGRLGHQDSWYAYDRPEHIREIVETFDDSVLDDSNWALGAEQYARDGRELSVGSDNHLASTT